MKIQISNNASNVQEMLQSVLNKNMFNVLVIYLNGDTFDGSICSFTYNHPITNLPPITALSLYVDNEVIDLDINQISTIESK